MNTEILIVEDDVASTQAYQLLLNDMNYSSVAVRTLKEAEKVLNQENRFRIVLINIDLPDGNGLDLAEVLHRNGHVQAIMISGHITTFLAKQFLPQLEGLREVPIIEKPVQLEEFQRTIKEAYERNGRYLEGKRQICSEGSVSA
jgi:DNA-binding NtrC family response regulator